MARKSKEKKEAKNMAATEVRERQEAVAKPPPPVKPESVDTRFHSRGGKRWENPNA
jgi:hypothetical protein